MTYLVLARKYRPQTFSEVVGQEHVTRTLANAFASGRVHHAFLFCGPRGCGKTTLARIVGKALNCENGPSSEPCGTCSACASIAAGSAIDYLEMDGASNRGIDAIRELTEAVRYQPAVLRKKVYVIDEVHMLTTEAFNALLKTLEEPPPHVTFVLATTEPHKLPNTILSRCQRYDFKLVPASRLAVHLARIFDAEKLSIEAGAVSLLVRESGGSVRDALSLSDQLISYVGVSTITERHVAEVLGVADRALTRTLVRALASGEAGAALGAVESAIERGVDEVQLARAIVRYLRDLSVLQVAPDRPELIDAADEERAELGREAATLERSRVAQMFERMLRCCDDLGKTLQPRLVLDCALIDVATVEPLIPLGDLVERLSELESRLTRGGAQPVARPAQRAPQPARPQQPQPSAQPSRQPPPAQPTQQPPAHVPLAPRAEQPAMSMTAQLEQHLEAQAGGGSSTRTVVGAVADAAHPGRKQAPAFATGTAPGVRGPAAPPAAEQTITAPPTAKTDPTGSGAGSDAKSGDAKSGDAKSGDAKSGDAKVADARDAKSADAKAPDKPGDKTKPKRKPEFADGSGARGGESNERAPGRPELAAGSGVRGSDGSDGGDEIAAAIADARAARDAALASGIAESKSGNVPPMTAAESKSASVTNSDSKSSGLDTKGADRVSEVPPMPDFGDIPHAADTGSSRSAAKSTSSGMTASSAASTASKLKSTASGSGPHAAPTAPTSGSGPFQTTGSGPLQGSGSPQSGSLQAGSGVSQSGSGSMHSGSGPMPGSKTTAGQSGPMPSGAVPSKTAAGQSGPVAMQSGPVSMQPSGPVPAPSTTASGSGPTGGSEQLTARPDDVLRSWNLVLGELETRRKFTLLGPFQHARVMKWSGELIELGFPVDVHSMGEMAADKAQVDELQLIVRELGSELAKVKVGVRLLDASESSQGTRSVLEDTRARTAIERGKRESEAREHPITKHVLQTFGAQIKEIKTDV